MGAQGSTIVDFGAFPGASDASVLVAETGVSNHPTSLAEAWLIPVDTVDHAADEHLVETIAVRAGPCVAGVGFTIYATNTGQINEPLEPLKGARNVTLSGVRGQPGNYSQQQFAGGIGTRIYGKWTVGWVWN